MAARPTSRPHRPAKKLEACPDCGSALTQAAAPVVRLVSSLDWTYPAPYAGQTCKACGWKAEVA
jgi:RNase P subunit RPR2